MPHGKHRTLYFSNYCLLCLSLLSYYTVKSFSQSIISSDSAFRSRMSSSIGAPDRYWIYFILYPGTALLLFACINTHTIHMYVNTRLLSNRCEGSLVYTASNVGLTAFTIQTFADSILHKYAIFRFFKNCLGLTLSDLFSAV